MKEYGKLFILCILFGSISFTNVWADDMTKAEGKLEVEAKITAEHQSNEKDIWLGIYEKLTAAGIKPEECVALLEAGVGLIDPDEMLRQIEETFVNTSGDFKAAEQFIEEYLSEIKTQAMEITGKAAAQAQILENNINGEISGEFTGSNDMMDGTSMSGDISGGNMGGASMSGDMNGDISTGIGNMNITGGGSMQGGL